MNFHCKFRCYDSWKEEMRVYHNLYWYSVSHFFYYCSHAMSHRVTECLVYQAHTSALIARQLGRPFQNEIDFMKVIFKFCTTSKFFIYLRQRYDKQQIAVLNNKVKASGRMRTCKFLTAFLKACILKKVVPTFMRTAFEKQMSATVLTWSGFF